MLKKNMFTPLPSNISYWWNFGSLLGACLVIQILSGLFLSMFYENNMTNSFDSINNIMRNINLGWMIRLIHANGASLFFIMIYMHIGRGLFFKSFSMKPVWLSGSLMLFTLMATAFIGYVLPWGQMSFWGATVITNLLSSIPYIGKMMTIWIWGNFSINKSTLMRFFSLHFILPFLMVAMATIHMIFLHKMSSSNPLGVNKNLDKIPFQPFFSFKDYTSLLISMIMFMLLTLMLPYLLMDPDNFMPANPMVTPVHIQPEWYFLFAYAILRSIPNKLGGVIALFMSIFIIMATTFIPLKKNLKLKFNLMYKILFFSWMFNTMYLTLMGMMPIEEPFENISKILSMNYFLFFAIYL